MKGNPVIPQAGRGQASLPRQLVRFRGLDRSGLTPAVGWSRFISVNGLERNGRKRVGGLWVALLIGAGVALILLGLAYKFGLLGWFGNLPGDIRYEEAA